MPTATRVVQLLIGVLLLASASVIAVGFGHGGFFLGQIAFFSPLYAIIVTAIVAAIITAACTAGPGVFTVVVSVFTALLLIPAALMIVLDGPALVVGISTLPLLAVWVIALVRGIIAVWAAHRRLAA